MTTASEDDLRDGDGKGPDAFRTISEVAEDLGLPQHVLRFWETRFPQIKPIKRGGGRRYYRPGDVELLRGVKQLLYGEGYTIRGVQRILREQGGRKIAQSAGLAARAPAPPAERSEPDFYAPRREAQAAKDPVDEIDRMDDVEQRDPSLDDGPAPAPAAPRPVEPVAAAPVRAGLSQAQAGKLASALDEMNACRRLLDGMS